ncbi:MAG: HDOD domain-containing protein, partial [Thiohalomonadales bacterium]
MEKNHIDNRTGVVPTMEALVNGVIGLVSLPEVCIRINQMLEDSRYSAAHIGKVISQDAALTARLLRIVNSAMYGYSVKVETVSRAITRVGHQELHGLVVAATVTGIFEKISTDLI